MLMNSSSPNEPESGEAKKVNTMNVNLTITSNDEGSMAETTPNSTGEGIYARVPEERHEEFNRALDFIEGRSGRYDTDSFYVIGYAVAYCVGCYAFMGQLPNLMAFIVEKGGFWWWTFSFTVPFFMLGAIAWKLDSLKTDYINMRRLLMWSCEDFLDCVYNLDDFRKKSKAIWKEKKVIDGIPAPKKRYEGVCTLNAPLIAFLLLALIYCLGPVYAIAKSAQVVG